MDRENQNPRKRKTNLSAKSPSKTETLLGHLTRNKPDIVRRLAGASEDYSLVLYKVLPATRRPKEPTDKYSLEYLWNVGASVRL